MNFSGMAPLRRSHLRARLAAAVLAGAVFAGGASAADVPAAGSAKPTSSCVACHTDLAKLQEEAKGIPIPTGSALQAGKG